MEVIDHATAVRLLQLKAPVFNSYLSLGRIKRGPIKGTVSLGSVREYLQRLGRPMPAVDAFVISPKRVTK